MTEFSDRLFSTPESTQFRSIIEHNIGIFPELNFADHGLSDHRVRIYGGDRLPEIIVSERALVTSEYLSDVIFSDINSVDTERVARALAVEYGVELFLRNRIQGLKFVAHGYESVGLVRMPIIDVLNRLTDLKSDETRVSRLVRVFYPIGHEIGHFDSAQSLAPAMLRGDALDAMREVGKFNYPLVVDFTGSFDFESALGNPESPLFAPHLREEVVADWFAIAALSHLVYQSVSEASQGKIEFPLLEFVSNMLTIPVVNALQSMFLGKEFSKSLIQETALAQHCRYSTSIDSIRGMLKAMFAQGSDANSVISQVDAAVDTVVTEMDKRFRVVHAALISLYELQREFFQLGETEIMDALVRILKDSQKQLHIGNLLKQIVDDSKGYPLSKTNRRFLEETWNSLLTFDNIVIDEDGRVISAQR